MMRKLGLLLTVPMDSIVCSLAFLMNLWRKSRMVTVCEPKSIMPIPLSSVVKGGQGMILKIAPIGKANK